MSMWQVSSVDGICDNDHHNYNAFAWQRLLSNLEFESKSESTSVDELNTAPRSCPIPTIGSKQSNASAKDRVLPVKLDANRTSSFAGSTIALQDDGYSSEEEHDSPDDQVASGSSPTPFYSSPTTTAITKGGNGGCVASIQSSSDATVPCFFVNGVRHSIEPLRKTPDWTAVPSLSSASQAKTVSMESPPWASAHVDPSTTPPKRVVAGSHSGVPSEGLCTAKSTTPLHSWMTPPLYATSGTLPTRHAIPASLPSSRMGNGAQGPFPILPESSTAYMANTASIMQPLPTSAMPVAQQARTPSFFSSNGSAANTTDSPALGFVFMDREGCFHLAPQGCAPPASALSALPMMHVSGGVTASPGMPQLQYTPSTIQAQSWRPTASLPCTASSGPWGSTKAWVFRDGSWMSLLV